jgi:hypothetical protein
MTSMPATNGDVLAVWTGRSPIQNLKRMAAALPGQPAVASHAIAVTHDPKRRWLTTAGPDSGSGAWEEQS